MTYKITMPALGETMDEGVIVCWRKAVGEYVKKGDVLLEVMTDKATFEVESRDSGYLRRILARDNEAVPVGQAIGYLADTMEESLENTPDQAKDEPSSKSASSKPGAGTTGDKEVASHKDQTQEPLVISKVSISPRARRLADEAGISLDVLARRFPHQRIEAADVQRFLQGEKPSSQVQNSLGPVKRTSLQGMRAIIARRMTASAQNAPQVTLVRETDAETLAAYHDQMRQNPVYQGVTLTDWIIKMTGEALVRHPGVNARLIGEVLEIHQSINIGLAMDTDHGLVVPVIKNVNDKSLTEVAAIRKSLKEKAAHRSLTEDDVSLGTFTVSNLGSYGIDFFNPLLNLPEIAILGVGRVSWKPSATERRLEMRRSLMLSLTFDHRVLDGGPAARFLATLASLIAQPPDWVGN